MDTSVVRARIFNSVIDVSSDSEDEDDDQPKTNQPKEVKVKGEPKKKKSRTFKKDNGSHPDFIREAFMKVAEKNEVQLRIAQEREKREAEESRQKMLDGKLNVAMKFIESSDPELKRIGQQMVKELLEKQGYEYNVRA